MICNNLTSFFLHSPGFAGECQDSVKYSLIAALFRIPFTQSDITIGEEKSNQNNTENERRRMQINQILSQLSSQKISFCS